MKENKMKTLRKVIPVIMLCLIPACPNDITWVTTDVPSTSGDSSSTGNLNDSSGESTDAVTESSTTSIQSSTSTTGGSTTLIESSTSETGNIPVCGNLIVESPEECDEGIPGTGTAFCTYNCTISFCGDNIVNFLDNEQCDDGNMNDLDSCNSKCQLPRN